MNYRKFGSSGPAFSVLGFGCMRLPTIGSVPDGPVDEKEAERCIRYAIDAGVNYLDAAKVYHNNQDEAILGRILRDGYREKVSIATKLPVWDVKTRADADRIFDEQRHDLRTDKIDLYLLHNLQRVFRDTLESNRLAEWAFEKKEKGQIGMLGFSFHDDYDFFVETIDSFDRWDFCQIQYNYTGENVQAGRRGLEYAAKKGLPVIVMEPLLGGCLARPVGKMGELFQSDEGRKFDPIDLAFRWLWSQKEVSVVLSGMSSFEQVEQNVRIARQGSVGTLTEEETAFIARLQDAYDKSMPIKCTKCRYCMPCPAGVDIPHNFEMYNNFQVMRELDEKMILYKLLYQTTGEGQQAGACVQCGQCEDSCPQQLPIRELLATVHETLKS